MYSIGMSTTTTTTVVAATPSVGQPTHSHHVSWAEDTVDNEGHGKKKSKKCCIFKKRREFGESSSESSGDEHESTCPSVNRK